MMIVDGASWCELYGEFTGWLDEAGLSVEGLPTWPAARPVRVLAAGGNLYLEKVSQDDYADFQAMVARGQQRLLKLPTKRLAAMRRVRITGVDPERLRDWRQAEAVTA